MKQRPVKPVTTPDTRTPRVPLPQEGPGAAWGVAASAHDATRASGQLLSLNTEGTFIVCEDANQAPFVPETYISLTVRVEEAGGGERSFEVRGWVVYTLEEGMAIQFDEPDPATLKAIRATVPSATSRATRTGGPNPPR
ncbi:MAG: hypothetical protein OEW11_00995 [Nitrospirota bacterium]|nr:hypothetical protein [Nitrospirota bacterium]